jgi:orotidine-5'-phosphate decarboxylase
METFGERLVEAIRQRGPLCVGIDPHPGLLTGWDLPDSAAGLARFCAITVEALAGTVAVLKPQSAFFERFGSAGIAVLESTIRQSREAGALVLLDVKRGDIGSTGEAYADAYLDAGSPLFADAVTVSPYVGFGALAPFLVRASASGAGVFVLALTSNPEGPEVQHARRAGGETVAQSVIDHVSACNAGAVPVGSVGVVVGATTGPTGHDLSRLNGPVLVPGLGAQGAAAADLPAVLAGLNGVALPSYSRSVLRRGPDIGSLRAAARQALEECRGVGMAANM